MSWAETPCTVCKQQLSRYTCPRCLARYCSAACYKLHGGRCTEAFYKEQVSPGPGLGLGLGHGQGKGQGQGRRLGDGQMVG